MERWKIRNIIQKWRTEYFDNVEEDFSRHIQISFEVYGIRNIYLYTNYPGIIIGKYGRCIDALRKMLKDKGINKKIHVIEVGFGRYVREINVKRSLL